MNLYQFPDIEITKDYLINEGLEKLYVKEDFVVDYKMIALFDISRDSRFSYGKTIVVHAEYGVFIDTRTSKQLVNELYLVNGVGFAVSKMLVNFFKITHYIPFVYGQVAYMPMTGASRKSADWIGLHFLKDFEQNGHDAQFLTRFDTKIKMNLPHGNLEDRLHDVYLLSQSSIKIMGLMACTGNCQLLAPKQMGLLQQFQECPCDNHIKLFLELDNLRQIIINFRDLLLSNLESDVLSRDENIKLQCQNLAKIKKLY